MEVITRDEIEIHGAWHLVGRKLSSRPTALVSCDIAVPAMRDRLSGDGIMMLLRRLGYAQFSNKSCFLCISSNVSNEKGEGD
jgi:hypothetical protein